MEVVLVAESLVQPKPDVSEPQKRRAGVKEETIFALHAIPLAANGETMQMIVRPTHRRLVTPCKSALVDSAATQIRRQIGGLTPRR